MTVITEIDRAWLKGVTRLYRMVTMRDYEQMFWKSCEVATVLTMVAYPVAFMVVPNVW